MATRHRALCLCRALSARQALFKRRNMRLCQCHRSPSLRQCQPRSIWRQPRSIWRQRRNMCRKLRLTSKRQLIRPQLRQCRNPL